MSTLEELEKLLEMTPGDVFEERYGRRPANDWWDTRALAGTASALRNRQGTAARKALPELLLALKAAREVVGDEAFCEDEPPTVTALRAALSPLLDDEAGP